MLLAVSVPTYLGRQILYRLPIVNVPDVPITQMFCQAFVCSFAFSTKQNSFLCLSWMFMRIKVTKVDYHVMPPTTEGLPLLTPPPRITLAVSKLAGNGLPPSSLYFLSSLPPSTTFPTRTSETILDQRKEGLPAVPAERMPSTRNVLAAPSTYPTSAGCLKTVSIEISAASSSQRSLNGTSFSIETRQLESA